MPRPTRKAISLTLGAILLFGVGANAQAGWLYVIGASMVGVVAAGLLLPRWVIKGVSVTRSTPDFATVGENIKVVLRFANNSGSNKMAFSGTDDFCGESRFVVRSLPARSTVSVSYDVVVNRRGIRAGAKVTLRSGAPFGVAVAKASLDVSSPMIVHPKWSSIPGFPLLESASAPNEALHDRSRRGAGMDFYGLREYRPGDSPRFVHWASTAKGGRLQVREFEEQLASRLTVMIDSSSNVGTEPETTFEDAVTAAASLVVYALEVGHPVQLFTDSKEGLLHLFEPTKIQTLDWLAGIEADGRRGLVRTAEAMMPEVFRRSTVIMIFPSTERNLAEAPMAAAALQSSGARVIAIIVAAHTYGRGDSLPPDRLATLESEMVANRAIVFRLEAGKEVTECLRRPVLV